MSGWSRIDIAGKPVDLFEPEQQPRHVVLYLHPVGLESLSDNPAYTNQLMENRLACIAPFGGHSWWSDRICSSFDPTISATQHILKNIVPHAHDRWKCRQLGIYGISMGGQGAIRLALQQPQLFPVVAGVASAFDYHEWYGHGFSLDSMYRSKEDCRQDTAILYIRSQQFPKQLGLWCDPEDDDWIRGNERFHSKLIANGLEHSVEFDHSAGGHTWKYFDFVAEPVVKFLALGLDRSSRQLL